VQREVAAQRDEDDHDEDGRIDRDQDDGLLRRHEEWQEGERDEADAEAGQPLDEAGRRDDDRADQPGERHGGGA
jgi:hypothetical protein